jgi:hypothetical protein
MVELALSDKSTTIETELYKNNEVQAIEHLISIREQAEKDAQLTTEELYESILDSLKGAAVEIYWRREGHSFSEEKKSTAVFDFNLTSRKVEFDLLLSVKDTPDELRLDFPGIKGVSFTFTKLELVSGNLTQLIDVNGVNLILQNNIQKRGNKITVIGGDPHFAFKVKDIPSDCVLHIVGFVQ